MKSKGLADWYQMLSEVCWGVKYEKDSSAVPPFSFSFFLYAKALFACSREWALAAFPVAL